MKVFFVILHYQAFEETCACVDSILNNYENVQVVIVDNASSNKSGVLLDKKYKNIESVNILISEKNLGFACGNNIGYRYAKDHDADFIIQVNNDTVFEDKDFVKKIEQLYLTYQFAVLGPDVICIKDGGHQNPLKGFEISSINIKKKIIKNFLGLLLVKFNLDEIFKHNNDYLADWKDTINISETPGVVLQGCCYIFSKNYIDIIDGMFEGTFMYYEEYILDYICRKKKLKMIYSPEIELKHLRQASTSSSVVSSRNKREFKYRQSIQSLQAFYRYIKCNK